MFSITACDNEKLHTVQFENSAHFCGIYRILSLQPSLLPPLGHDAKATRLINNTQADQEGGTEDSGWRRSVRL